jgi:hypothetical protein
VRAIADRGLYRIDHLARKTLLADLSCPDRHPRGDVDGCVLARIMVDCDGNKRSARLTIPPKGAAIVPSTIE